MMELRVEMGTATTERSARASRAGNEQAVASRPKAVRGSDRISVVLFSLAGFLAVLALLAGQLRAAAPQTHPRREVVVRRIYQTTVVDSAAGSNAAPSTSESVSSSGSGYSSAPAPATRSS